MLYLAVHLYMMSFSPLFIFCGFLLESFLLSLFLGFDLLAVFVYWCVQLKLLDLASLKAIRSCFLPFCLACWLSFVIFCMLVLRVSFFSPCLLCSFISFFSVIAVVVVVADDVDAFCWQLALDRNEDIPGESSSFMICSESSCCF